MMFELEAGSKRYGMVNLFTNLDLRMEHGEIVSILGPSGCGKTTLLRTICGLESLDGGRRRLNGALLVNGELHPNITMLFQQPVLLQWPKTLAWEHHRASKNKKGKPPFPTCLKPLACPVSKTEALLSYLEVRLSELRLDELFCSAQNSCFWTNRLHRLT